MIRYVIPIMLLTILVDLLLLIAAGRLSGFTVRLTRTVVAAIISGVFAGVSLVAELRFMKSGLWHLIQLCVVIVLGYGIQPATARLGLSFLWLKLALHGASEILRSGSVLSVILSAGVIAVLWAYGQKGQRMGTELIPVELRYGDKQWKLTALRDTGNMLRDPLTGDRVIVAGADMGLKLLGLTAGQLSDPTRTLASGLAPGMRLIPYQTVGQQGAMMLGMRIKNVKVGSWQGSAVVAFAPECFGKNEGYQMLVGGCFG